MDYNRLTSLPESFGSLHMEGDLTTPSAFVPRETMPGLPAMMVYEFRLRQPDGLDLQIETDSGHPTRAIKESSSTCTSRRPTRGSTTTPTAAFGRPRRESATLLGAKIQRIHQGIL